MSILVFVLPYTLVYGTLACKFIIKVTQKNGKNGREITNLRCQLFKVNNHETVRMCFKGDMHGLKVVWVSISALGF